jgi:DNA helicase II / ATP-dependent DNA helicase PcrA
VADTLGRVRAALADGRLTSEVAVLTRVNALLAPVQVALVSAGITVNGGVGLEFLDRTSVRAALSWVRLASSASRSERTAGFAASDLAEALRRPSRPLHPRIGEWVAEQRDLDGVRRLAGRLTNERDATRVAEFADDIARLQQRVSAGATTAELVDAIADEVGLAGSVATLDATRRGMNRSAQGDDLAALRQLAALHDDALGFETWLREHLAARRDPSGVVLATVHRVKGQEWPEVVVHYADAEQYPHRLADDIEEERRLFHVALTRASSHATVVTGPRPSRFVAESTSGGADPAADLDAAGQARFAALRDLRNDLRDGKPAYVVFDNKTLAAIARQAPTTLRDLGRIAGVGPAKLERYGDAVIALMQRHT